VFDKIKQKLGIYQNLTQTLPKNQQKATPIVFQEPKPLTYKNTTKNLQCNTKTLPKSSLLTAETSGKISDYPLRVWLVIGRQGVGKTTLVNFIANHFSMQNYPVVILKKPEDILTTNSVIIADDLTSNLTRATLRFIVDNIRVIRHKKNILIITHHLIRDIPRELFALCDKVILFNTALTTRKAKEFIPNNKLETIKDLVKTLEPYKYIIVKSGKIYGVYSNTEISPIINTPTKVLATINAKFLEVIEKKIPEYELLTTTQRIIALKRKFPHLKPKAIAMIVGTTPQYCWKILSLSRNGKL